MSWLEDLNKGKLGMFGMGNGLPFQTKQKLIRLLDKCNDGSFTYGEMLKDGNWTDFDEFNDIENFIDNNDIELEEYESDLIRQINVYVTKNVRYNSSKELYEGILRRCTAVQCPTSEGMYAEMASYLPEDYNKKLPTKGGWIMIKKDIPVEDKAKPVLYGVYFAKGVWRDSGMALNIAKEYKLKFPNAGKQYIVKTNNGNTDVFIHPHEYIVVDGIKAILAEIGVGYDLVKLGGTPNIDEDRVHYLQSRGIKKEDIYMRMLEAVNVTNFCYFHPREEMINELDRHINGIYKSVFEKFVPETIKVNFKA